jgi:hypothetical protein
MQTLVRGYIIEVMDRRFVLARLTYSVFSRTTVLFWDTQFSQLPMLTDTCVPNTSEIDETLHIHCINCL